MNGEENKKKPENIFDLTKLAPFELDIELKKQPTVIDIDEKNKLLTGFNELPVEEWDTLKYNDHIRYLRNDGTFRRGGYFKNSWIGTYGKNKDKRCIQLGSSKMSNTSMWSLCYDDIHTIWKNTTVYKKKSNNDTDITGEAKEINQELQNMVNTMQETIQYMSKSIEQLKIDVLKNNNEQKRIINLIKKLHGIKSSGK